MTTVALDPPHRGTSALTPKSGRSVRRAGGRRRPLDKGRIAAVVGVGVAVAGGFAGAMTLLSGLAAPPPRPVIAIKTRAAEWPDLRDGVPALSRPAPAAQSQAADVPGQIAAVADTVTVPSASPASLRAALDPVAPPAAAGRKPAGRVPQIENASLVASAREATLIVPLRSATLLRPLASETVRARTAAASTFASLEPEESTASVATPLKEPAAREPAKPRVRTTGVKPVRVTAPVTATAAASPPAEADSDDTEVLGVKIPSLASAGRRLRDAFGGGETASASAQ